MIFSNIKELFLKLVTHQLEESALENFIIVENIPEVFCKKCGRKEKIYKRPFCKNTARCSWCSTQHNVIKFKQLSSFTLYDYLKFICYYILGIKPNAMSIMLNKSAGTIKRQIRTLREIITSKYECSLNKIGGIGHVVEIDETCVGRRKNHKGRVRNQVWIFGAVDRSTGRFLMKKVQNRKSETLGNAIEQMIEQYSHIESDEWPAYFKYFSKSNLYTHSTVNHTFNFIDPLTGSHTQTIEARWGSFKKWMRSMGYKSRIKLNQYIVEYILRCDYKNEEVWKLFEKIINLIS